jgi:hypothetical protein
MITMLRATATATAAAQLLRAHLVAAGSCSLTPPTPQTPLALEPSSSRGVTAARVSEHASNKPHSLPLLLVASWLHPCLQHLPPTPPPHAAASGNGADINVPREEDNRTPLHIAVNEGHEDVVEALLAAGGGQEGGRAGLKAAGVEQGWWCCWHQVGGGGQEGGRAGLKAAAVEQGVVVVLAPGGRGGGRRGDVQA